MPTSTVPAVWSALHALVEGLAPTVTLFGTDLALTVHYGPPMVEDANHVCIGYSEAGPAVQADNEWAALGQQKHEERYSIACLIRVGTGEVDLAAVVTAAYAALAEITAAIADDYTLGETCRVAHVAEHSADVLQDSSGASVLVPFSVNVAARI